MPKIELANSIKMKGEGLVLLRILIGVLLVLHGAIHGILAVLPNPDAAEPVAATFFSEWASPWLKSRLSGRAPQTIAIALAVIAGVGFFAPGLAMFDFILPHEYRLSAQAGVRNIDEAQFSVAISQGFE